MVRNVTLPWAVACFCLGSGWVGPGRGHMKGSLCQAAKDVQSKSNEDQNTWADLRTCMPHIIQACRATSLLTSLVFFSRSFKVDKVRALISRVRALWLKSSGAWTMERKHPRTDKYCLFSPSFISAAIAFCSTGKLDFLYSRCLLHFTYTVAGMEDAPSLAVTRQQRAYSERIISFEHSQ